MIEHVAPVNKTYAGKPLPKTSGWPVVGSIPGLARKKLDFILDNRQAYGDIYSLDLGVTDLVVLTHPRQADHVLRQNMRNYEKGGALWDSIRDILGNGLPVSEGEFWRQCHQRSIRERENGHCERARGIHW